MGNNTDFELFYLFDPFCGWCYASAPALAEVARTDAVSLRMMPSGLFADNNARPIDAMAKHAWTNDSRINELTGQKFTEAYRVNVLLKPNGVFDSGAATRAITLIGQIDAQLEPALLHDLQIARYVDGRDTALATEVARVTGKTAKRNGYEVDVDHVLTRLESDQELWRGTDERVGRTQRLMDRLELSGVPQLVVASNGRFQPIRSADLYQGAEAGRSALVAAKERTERP